MTEATQTIVERLQEIFERRRYGPGDDYDPDIDILEPAAAEIERLQAIVKELEDRPSIALEALKLAEKADRIHSRCQECEDAAQSPEACEHCFPSADDARVARRNALKALGVLMRDVDRSVLLSKGK